MNSGQGKEESASRTSKEYTESIKVTESVWSSSDFTGSHDDSSQVYGSVHSKVMEQLDDVEIKSASVWKDNESSHHSAQILGSVHSRKSIAKDNHKSIEMTPLASVRSAKFNQQTPIDVFDKLKKPNESARQMTAVTPADQNDIDVSQMVQRNMNNAFIKRNQQRNKIQHSSTQSDTLQPKKRERFNPKTDLTLQM